MQFVEGIQYIMTMDCLETRRVLSLTGKKIKRNFVNKLWQDVYKGLRNKCDDAWVNKISKLLFGFG